MASWTDPYSSFRDSCDEMIGFAGALRELHQAKGKTQVDVADVTNYSKSQYGRFLDEIHPSLPVNLSEVEKIADALGCTQPERVRLIGAFICAILRQRGVH